MANFDVYLIDRVANEIVESVTGDNMSEVLHEIMEEQYDPETDAAEILEVGFTRLERQLLAQALLRAAEQMFIQALGRVEDSTPSSVSVGR